MDDILYPLHSFKEQFGFTPTVVGKENLTKKTHVIICGMGGSAIAVSLMKILYPNLSITLHNTYGLPSISSKEATLLILNSYSGNTEEILDTFTLALQENISCAALSRGGELIKKAVENNVPHIVLPSIGVEPRFAMGHQLIGLLTLMSEEHLIPTLKESVDKADIVNAEKDGKDLASALSGKYPILYASQNLYPVAYLIKAAINEGAKMPCFINIIPEANHNEVQGYVSPNSEKEKASFMFVFFTSVSDHPRILRRFDIMTSLYHDEGFGVASLSSDHTNHTKLFELILTGYFSATFYALARNVDLYKTPFIAKFKERML